MRDHQIDTDAVLSADKAFFRGLLAGNTRELAEILAADFVIVDVNSADVTDRAEFIDAISSGLFSLQSLERGASDVRSRPGIAVVVGTTRMTIQLGNRKMTVQNRYTHVFVNDAGSWRLLSAHGTPLYMPKPLDTQDWGRVLQIHAALAGNA